MSVQACEAPRVSAGVANPAPVSAPAPQTTSTARCVPPDARPSVVPPHQPPLKGLTPPSCGAQERICAYRAAVATATQAATAAAGKSVKERTQVAAALLKQHAESIPGMAGKVKSVAFYTPELMPAVAIRTKADGDAYLQVVAGVQKAARDFLVAIGMDDVKGSVGVFSATQPIGL